MFLNPLMLAGLGGAVLPLVVHLLNRARYRTMDWGAMMFLPGAQGRQEQSNRLKQILLLILRMAIVATLAVALARPVVGAGWAAVGSDPHCCAVILLDTSASMAYDDGGATRMDAARRAALAVLAGLQRGDEVDLVTLGDDRDAGDAPPPSDLQTAASRIADLHVSDGRADIAAGLNTAARIFQRSSAGSRLLVLICDRQASSWKEVDEDFASAWRASASQQSPSPLAANPGPRSANVPKFVVISVGSEACENVAVDRVSPPAAPVVRDVPVPLDVTVHNYGRDAVNNLPLSLESSGGHSGFHTTVDLPAGASTAVTLTPRFSTVGPHVLRARIHPDVHAAGEQDPANLTFDDELDAIVNVVDPLEVCIITGDAADTVAIRQADALRLALMPYKSAGEKGPDLANVTLFNPTDPWPADLSSFRVIVLADLPQLDQEQAQRIEQFVFDGGGLLIAPGDFFRAGAYDDLLYRDGAGVLPARLSTSTAPPVAQNIVPADLAHPILSFLRGQSDPTFTATVSRYVPAVVQTPSGRIITRFSDGSPMLIEKSFGRGRVLLSTTTLGSAWSTLPRSSLFLPLVESAIRYLASGNEDQQTLTPGQPIEAHFAGALGDRGTIILPDGSRENSDLIRVGGQAVVRFEDTGRAGIYNVTVHTAKGDQAELFVVQSTRDESDLTPLTAARWAELENWLGFTRVDAQSADLAAQAADRRGGREMWLTLIAALLALMVAESAFSRRLSSEI
jgi:hypothetical protein